MQDIYYICTLLKWSFFVLTLNIKKLVPPGNVTANICEIYMHTFNPKHNEISCRESQNPLFLSYKKTEASYVLIWWSNTHIVILPIYWTCSVQYIIISYYNWFNYTGCPQNCTITILAENSYSYLGNDTRTCTEPRVQRGEKFLGYTSWTWWLTIQ